MRKTVIVLAAALLASGAIAANSPKDAKPGKPIAATGVITDCDRKGKVVMVWLDGEDTSTKFAFAEGFDMSTFDFPPKGKAVFVPDRVQFTYIKGDGGNKVLAMQRAMTPLNGMVTGEVQFSNDFWVAVKPKKEPLDGYAISWPPGDMQARLKALKKGDRVTIRFHTDVERHRIEALQVLPGKPALDAANAKEREKSAQRQAVATEKRLADANELRAAREKRIKEDSRVWTAASGGKTVKATFSGRIGDKIKLKKEEGSVITVTFDQLSETDQKWLEDRAKE